MKKFAIMAMLACAATSPQVDAESISQTTMNNGVISTTVETPNGTTIIRTTPGHSIVTGAENGMKFEIDSDDSVYQIFPDGARVAAPNGQHTLLNGQTITVKDGKRIP